MQFDPNETQVMLDALDAWEAQPTLNENISSMLIGMTGAMGNGRSVPEDIIKKHELKAQQETQRRKRISIMMKAKILMAETPIIQTKENV